MRVPEGYQQVEVERLANMRNGVMNEGGIIDKVYEELVAVMKVGLIEVKVRRAEEDNLGSLKILQI